ncbi:hypothetical protein KUH03_40460 [Sphingobacterium sp. E70]|uniref:hypothetical protein n=1 Tax=Sphingobacterium sp. E70 TaxID=2853439 RepID=UPI00211C8C6B|nr:hypothetical protein [Sphingobacterium sp. E70]ULT25066.1 hypothetical protein KUH03_40460 [Sphingobacterium sp. E70]
MKKHGLIFLFSWILMLMAIVPVAFVIYRLDSYKFLGQNEIIRYLIQFALLVLVLGAVALRVVYKVYLVVFGQDLQKVIILSGILSWLCSALSWFSSIMPFERKERLITIKKKRVKVMQKWLLQKDEQIRAEEKKE